jgi:hypothetical protein
LSHFGPGPAVLTSSRPALVCASEACHRSLRVRATVCSQIRAGDVRRLRASHERDQCDDFVNRSVAVERCVGLLGCRPIARRRIQIRVDRTGLDIVDRDGSNGPRIKVNAVQEIVANI